MSAAFPLAVLALVPVILGPAPAERSAITATLCNGGTITIPLGEAEPAPRGDCHLKGCHAGPCRARAKRPI